MLSENSKFTEAKVSKPIAVPDIAYDVFIQVLNFIYTGHVDLTKFSHYIASWLYFKEIQNKFEII